MELTKEQVKLATVATTINWKVVERFTRKFGYSHPEEMVFDWCIDPELVYERGLKRKPNPFHKHVRLNLDKMLMCGIATPEEMIDAGLKLTKKQIQDIKLAQEEAEDYVEGA
tara:strand:+ start:73 stop:408 length:336 start_codon:yes stop_codon:yes gene_type:complete